jgi:endonuclease YncB( thermonuclease family)
LRIGAPFQSRSIARSFSSHELTRHQCDPPQRVDNPVCRTVLIAMLVSMSMPAMAQQPILGIAQAKDGDSLEVNGVRIRLYGIDAPELSQTCNRGGKQWPCGRDAFDNLSGLATGREVRCSRLGRDDFDRVLAKCTVGGFEVNRTMVERGYATAFRKYSNDYVAAENRAKEAGLGIWASEFNAPADVRAEGQNRASTRSEAPARPEVRSLSSAPSNCRIKGNHSRKGDWIYHLPGMPYYNQTRAEAMFCTEAEARAAGYRRARTPRSR